MGAAVSLETVRTEDMAAFKRRLQDAFTQEESGDYPGEDDGLFKFEKDIAR